MSLLTGARPAVFLRTGAMWLTTASATGTVLGAPGVHDDSRPGGAVHP